MKTLRNVLTIALACAALSLTACARTKEQPTPDAAAMFRDAMATHEQSASLRIVASDRATLLDQVAEQYSAVLAVHSEDGRWAAQALRSLGKVRAEQGHLDDAIACYIEVGNAYAEESWEVLQSWKSAADLLWDAGRKAEATVFYRQIVDRWNGANTSDIEARIVSAAARRADA